eukprot:4122601-Pleurochrysis_carterae.AAC.1
MASAASVAFRSLRETPRSQHGRIGVAADAAVGGKFTISRNERSSAQLSKRHLKREEVHREAGSLLRLDSGQSGDPKARTGFSHGRMPEHRRNAAVKPVDLRLSASIAPSGIGDECIKNMAGKLRQLLHLSENLNELRSISDLRRVAAAISTGASELIYTTVSMDSSRLQLVMLRQWFGNLGAAAVNTLLIGIDQVTCAVARNASLPCFVDGLAPKLRGRQNNFGPQVLTQNHSLKSTLTLRQMH